MYNLLINAFPNASSDIKIVVDFVGLFLLSIIVLAKLWKEFDYFHEMGHALAAVIMAKWKKKYVDALYEHIIIVLRTRHRSKKKVCRRLGVTIYRLKNYREYSGAGNSGAFALADNDNEQFNEREEKIYTYAGLWGTLPISLIALIVLGLFDCYYFKNLSVDIMKDKYWYVYLVFYCLVFLCQIIVVVIKPPISAGIPTFCIRMKHFEQLKAIIEKQISDKGTATALMVPDYCQYSKHNKSSKSFIEWQNEMIKKGHVNVRSFAERKAEIEGLLK